MRTVFLQCPRAWLVLLAGLLTACASTPQPNNQHELPHVVITLERTPCYGFCPVYKLTILGDGTVIYDGRQFVKVEGRREAKISTKDVAMLIKRFQEIDYFSLKESYTRPVTDLSTTVTSLTLGDRSKTVRNYAGAPRELIELEKLIDRTANVQQWVGREFH